MKLITKQEFAQKGKASLVHLLLSVLVASIAAFMVFGVWFPYPYSEVSGGRTLFTLVIWVDISCGPLLTFVLFNTRKSRKELFFDLGLVGIIQVAALIYGIYTVMLARPAYLVFEVDRFQVISLADIAKEELPEAKKEFQTAPIFSGPRLIAAKGPAPDDPDYMRTIELGMQGIDISSRPKYWVSYAEKIDDVLKRSKPIAELRKKSPEKETLIDAAIKKSKLTEAELVYIPMHCRQSFEWSAILNSKTAEVVGFVNVDGS